MRYYLVWLTSELSEEQQRLLGSLNPGVLSAHWNGYDRVWMTELGVQELEKIGVVHLKGEVSKETYEEAMNQRRRRMPQQKTWLH